MVWGWSFNSRRHGLFVDCSKDLHYSNSEFKCDDIHEKHLIYSERDVLIFTVDVLIKGYGVSQNVKPSGQELSDSGAYLVLKGDGGHSESGVVPQFDCFLSWLGGGAGAAHDLDRDLVVDKVTGHPADEDASFDLAPVQSEVSALDGEQGASLQRTRQRVDLGREDLS